MNDRISFHCRKCEAHLRAPVRLAGRSIFCPGCGQSLTVPLQPPAEEPSMLVMDDGYKRDYQHS